jgi:hypothetical protein
VIKLSMSLFLILAGGAVMSNPSDAQDTHAAAAAQRTAALLLIAKTPTDQRAELLQPFDLGARSNWHYTPRKRAGVPLGRMNEPQRSAAQQLLAAALSDRGLVTVRAVMALEIALRELEGSAIRDPENYAFAIYGTPDNAAWGWRIEGHHLSLHFSLSGAHVVSSLPQFLGANPAEAPRDFVRGPRKGQRALKDEEDRALALFGSLRAAQRMAATIGEQPYGDILTRNAAKIDPFTPSGIVWIELDPAQQATLLRLIDAFASVVERSLAEQRLARVHAGGLEAIRFSWAGAAERGRPYYFRIQGPLFLIELDNSGGNHVHSVWRDFDGDWGRDALAEHYRTARGTSHQH